MDKEQILNIFNAQFKEFIEDISRVFPDNADILTMKVTIKQLLAITPKIVYKGYKKHVVDPYRSEIQLGDINFFIDKDYKSDLNKNGSTNNIILDKIDCLRQPVREMNKVEQEKVIKYMQNMTKLCDLYESSE